MPVDLARAYAAAMAAKDLDALDALLTDDVCVVTPKGKLLSGVEAVKAYYAGDGFDHLDLTTEDHDFSADVGGGARRHSVT